MIDWGAIKTNLASGAIIAILGSLAGFLLGTSQLSELSRRNDDNARRLNELDKRLDGIDKVQDDRRLFIGDAARRLEFICNRERECRERFDPMTVPR